jgi:inner membrane protein YidH
VNNTYTINPLENEEVQIRNRLAVDRTKLANERIFLAYMRTAIMLFASGFTLLKLIEKNQVQEYIGYVLYVFAILSLSLGFLSYARVMRTIRKLTSDQKS